MRRAWNALIIAQALSDIWYFFFKCRVIGRLQHRWSLSTPVVRSYVLTILSGEMYFARWSFAVRMICCDCTNLVRNAIEIHFCFNLWNISLLPFFSRKRENKQLVWTKTMQNTHRTRSTMTITNIYAHMKNKRWWWWGEYKGEMVNAIPSA